jgi:hypothetical protein
MNIFTASDIGLRCEFWMAGRATGIGVNRGGWEWFRYIGNIVKINTKTIDIECLDRIRRVNKDRVVSIERTK